MSATKIFGRMLIRTGSPCCLRCAEETFGALYCNACFTDLGEFLHFMIRCNVPNEKIDRFLRLFNEANSAVRQKLRPATSPSRHLYEISTGLDILHKTFFTATMEWIGLHDYKYGKTIPEDKYWRNGDLGFLFQNNIRPSLVRGCIYLFSNEASKKVYVGQVGLEPHRNLWERIKEHFLGIVKEGTELLHALLSTPPSKWGKLEGYWAVTILGFSNSAIELNGMESFWIRVLGSLIPNGYNMKRGNKGTLPPGYEAIEEVFSEQIQRLRNAISDADPDTDEVTLSAYELSEALLACHR
eukprot:TRINITY_DN654_c1_g1_i1.p1 TRINITY_DN654_c1_g1~~TRINITY_DN654_c1_g1_i1.p1  ORF type:complete len:298 (+),score=6.12 TRINITY_DN654_c1_g1_i1:79-972(+)